LLINRGRVADSNSYKDAGHFFSSPLTDLFFLRLTGTLRFVSSEEGPVSSPAAWVSGVGRIAGTCRVLQATMLMAICMYVDRLMAT
jgi:hypothetical protein